MKALNRELMNVKILDFIFKVDKNRRLVLTYD